MPGLCAGHGHAASRTSAGCLRHGRHAPLAVSATPPISRLVRDCNSVRLETPSHLGLVYSPHELALHPSRDAMSRAATSPPRFTNTQQHHPTIVGVRPPQVLFHLPTIVGGHGPHVSVLVVLVPELVALEGMISRASARERFSRFRSLAGQCDAAWPAATRVSLC